MHLQKRNGALQAMPLVKAKYRWRHLLQIKSFTAKLCKQESPRREKTNGKRQQKFLVTTVSYFTWFLFSLYLHVYSYIDITQVKEILYKRELPDHLQTVSISTLLLKQIAFQSKVTVQTYFRVIFNIMNTPGFHHAVSKCLTNDKYNITLYTVWYVCDTLGISLTFYISFIQGLLTLISSTNTS